MRSVAQCFGPNSPNVQVMTNAAMLPALLHGSSGLFENAVPTPVFRHRFAVIRRREPV